VDGTAIVSAERGGDTAGSVRVVLTVLWGKREMVGVICSSVELSKCVSVLVPSDVDGFVSTVYLLTTSGRAGGAQGDEVLKVPLDTSG